MIELILFVDNLFFYLGGQSVSCKASLAALRLYGYFCDFCFVFVSENKYDDDDVLPHVHSPTLLAIFCALCCVLCVYI